METLSCGFEGRCPYFIESYLRGEVFFFISVIYCKYLVKTKKIMKDIQGNDSSY